MQRLKTAIGDLGETWLEALTLRPATQRAYAYEFRRLAAWVQPQLQTLTTSLSADFLTSYLTDLASTDEACLARIGLHRPLKESSILQAKRILTALFEWAAAQGHAPATIAFSARSWRCPANRDVREPLPPHKGRTKRRSLDSEAKLRRAFVLGLACWAGARPTDIAALRRSDVRVQHTLLEVVLPDGRRQPKNTLLPPHMAVVWQDLIETVGPGEFAVVKLRRNEPLSASGVARIIAREGGRQTTARQWREHGVSRFRKAGWPEGSIRAQLRRTSTDVGVKKESERQRRRRLESIERRTDALN